MTFTCPAQSSITDSELTGTIAGLLPSTPNTDSDRDSTGLLTAGTIGAIVASLKGSGVIPVATGTNVDVYQAKQKVLLQTIKSEYCFYDSRYKYALEKFFNAIRQGFLDANTTTTPSSNPVADRYVKFAQGLNRRLNDLIQIVNAISEDSMKASTTMNTDMSTMTQTMKDSKKKLDQQNKIISAGEPGMRIKKEMVKYSEEKARHTDHLLKLYSFLNIVALGLLVYIYKAAE